MIVDNKLSYNDFKILNLVERIVKLHVFEIFFIIIDN